MSTPIMLRVPKRVASANVISPSLQPTSRQRRFANQLRSKHCREWWHGAGGGWRQEVKGTECQGHHWGRVDDCLGPRPAWNNKRSKPRACCQCPSWRGLLCCSS